MNMFLQPAGTFFHFRRQPARTFSFQDLGFSFQDYRLPCVPLRTRNKNVCHLFISGFRVFISKSRLFHFRIKGFIPGLQTVRFSFQSLTCKKRWKLHKFFISDTEMKNRQPTYLKWKPWIPKWKSSSRLPTSFHYRRQPAESFPSRDSGFSFQDYQLSGFGCRVQDGRGPPVKRGP